MREVSERFRDSIGGYVRWVTEVDWTNDGGATWVPAQVVSDSATVTASSTSQIRWTMSITLDGAPVGTDGINPFTTQLRIRHGMDGELLGMGEYKIDEVNRSTETPTLVELTGTSFESFLIAARFTVARRLGGEDGEGRLDTLITEVLPNATIWWDRVDGGRYLAAQIVERDRWAVIDGPASSPSIARALGARVYTNGDGVFIVAPVPTLQDAPSFEIAAGDLLITATESASNEQVYNRVVAVGESMEGTPSVYGVADDEDPFSLTFIGRSAEQGGFGVRPRFYSSQLITTRGQAVRAAKSMLAPALGRKQQVSFETVHDPTKEPGDVGIVDTPSGPIRVILDTVTYSLSGGPLQCETRTTAVEETNDEEGSLE